MKITFEVLFYAHKDYGGTGQHNEARIEFTDVYGIKKTIAQYFTYQEINNEEIKAILINKMFYSLKQEIFQKIPPLIANEAIEDLN